MPEDMLKSTTNEQEKNTSEKTDALLPQKQDILQAFGKDKNDTQGLQKLGDVIKPIQDNIDKNTADNIMKDLSRDKGWIQSLKIGFDDFVKHINTFIGKKIMNGEDISVSDMKTYVEIKAIPKNNEQDKIIDNIKGNDINKTLKNLVIESNNTKVDIKSTIDENNNEIILSKEQQADQILNNIDKKLEAKKPEITSLPTYQAEKATFEQQLGTKVDDGYFVTRFALGHIGEPNAYLTQADLGGQKQEDLIARLNEKYNVNEVVSLQDKTFQNNQFDGRVNGQTRQEIATKGGSFETVFTAAELEFYKKDSQLRNNLHGLVQGGIFAEAKSVTNDKNYWNGEKDATTWIPKNALQNDQAFSQWMEKNQIPNTVKAGWMKYYTEVYKKTLEKPQNELTDGEKNEQALFLQNIAGVEAATYRNTVQESTTKIIAENLFADIAAMTGKDIAGASDWKLLKQPASGDYFAMDADGNTKMAYELNGVQGDIVIDKKGVVTMGPVLGQESGYSDIIAKKRQVGQILGVTSYIAMVDKIVGEPGNSLRDVPADAILSEIRKNIKHDIVASEVTKASMQTNIARQSMFDTILSKTNSPRTTDIKAHLGTNTFSDKPLVSGIDKNDYSRLLLGLYEYSKTSSKSQIESVTNAYNTLQQYLANNPAFSENKNIKTNPEHIANILNKFPIGKWGDVKIVWEKQFKEEKAKTDIDNELAALEQKIDNNFQ